MALPGITLAGYFFILTKDIQTSTSSFAYGKIRHRNHRTGSHGRKPGPQHGTPRLQGLGIQPAKSMW